MKYLDLSYEERELQLFINNDEQCYRAIQVAIETGKGLIATVKQCSINYKRLNANVNDMVFSEQNIKNVAEYYRDYND